MARNTDPGNAGGVRLRDSSNKEYACTGAVDPDPYNGGWWENAIALTFYGVAKIGFRSETIEDLKEVIAKVEARIKNEIETLQELTEVPSNVLKVPDMLMKAETKKR